MLKEVEEYFAAKEAAQADYTQRVEAVQAALHAAGASSDYQVIDKARTAYYATQSASEALRDAEQRAAWLRLGLVTDDRLVTYITTRVPDHQRGEGEKVLRYLPATVMQLREVAAEADWCGEFNNHLAAARREGFIEDDRDATEAALEDWIESNVSNRYAPELLKRIDAALKARVEAALAETPAPEVSQVTADLEGEHEVQLARVDAVWARVRELAPQSIDRDAAEFLFRRAVQAVVTGRGELYDVAAEEIADEPDVEAAF